MPGEWARVLVGSSHRRATPQLRPRASPSTIALILLRPHDSPLVPDWHGISLTRRRLNQRVEIDVLGGDAEPAEHVQRLAERRTGDDSPVSRTLGCIALPLSHGPVESCLQ